MLVQSIGRTWTVWLASSGLVNRCYLGLAQVGRRSQDDCTVSHAANAIFAYAPGRTILGRSASVVGLLLLQTHYLSCRSRMAISDAYDEIVQVEAKRGKVEYIADRSEGHRVP
jgi:hypothetical protein